MYDEHRIYDISTQVKPVVSIGLPVYNGERYLHEALDSLLAQDYKAFELLISDNASEDDTEAICREYAARDARIRYYRSKQNGGAVQNFLRVFELSHGEYFMWAASDDLRHPQYVRRCVQALEAHPGAVMCCTGLQLIDEVGREVRESDYTYGIRVAGRTARGRVRALAQAHAWYDCYGLIRRSALERTRLPQPVWGFDVVLLMELCLRGEVLLVPEKLFLYRVFCKKTGQTSAAGLGSAHGSGRVTVSYSDLCLELARSIWLAPLGPLARLALLVEFLWEFCVRNAVTRYNIRRDVAVNARRALGGRRYGRCMALVLIGTMAYAVQGARRLMWAASKHKLPFRPRLTG